MDRTVHELLVERLNDDAGPDGAVRRVVLAAWAGDADLAAVLGGVDIGDAEPPRAPESAPGPEVYLAGIDVQAFRGVGPRAYLPLRPGPGLTLVTGRNGSGKSSFAEAAELALTGTSRRWAGRSAVWSSGWRNLHAAGTTAIRADLVTAGATGTTRIERRWDDGAALEDARWTRATALCPDGEPFDGSPWAEDMTTYRPFLSYSELGSLIDGKPTELHDAVHKLLGLGSLTEAIERIKSARKSLTDQDKTVSDTRKALRAELLEVDDSRAARAAELLRTTAPDLDAVAELVRGTDDDTAGTAVLSALLGLEAPDPDLVAAAADRLRAAADGASERDDTGTRAADRIAGLLRTVLDEELTDDSSCPVCLTGTLDERWRAEARRRATQFEEESAHLREAGRELDAARAAARDMTTHRPAIVDGPAPVDLGPIAAAWTGWQAAGRVDGPAELAHALVTAAGPLHDAVSKVREQARAELSHRDEIWAPLARQLGAWHDASAAWAVRRPALDLVKHALTWLSGTADALRDARLSPFAAESQQIWQTLRQQSNVDLGPVRLGGTGNRRHVALDVRIDGAGGGTALGVMSQGELHSLGLSLFLPRATVEQSPFRFVMVDDPVQAMDPAKVDGLAQVLADVARTRQVVVFTHDDRLAEAVRRLEISATVWEVQRGERSAVELRRCDDPVTRYLDDAHAMARTPKLPSDLRGELVAACSRSAVEAACHERVRAVRLGRGERHADVEQALTRARTTREKATLAVFDDPGRRDLVPEIRKSLGPAVADTFRDCTTGTHQGLDTDLVPFVRRVARLTEWLRG